MRSLTTFLIPFSPTKLLFPPNQKDARSRGLCTRQGGCTQGDCAHGDRTLVRSSLREFGEKQYRQNCRSAAIRKEIILRSNSPWGFCPFQPPNSPKGQVVRVSGELLPCMTRGSSHRPLRLLTGSPSMPHEPSRVVSRRGICLHAVQHGGVACVAARQPDWKRGTKRKKQSLHQIFDSNFSHYLREVAETGKGEPH